MADSNETKPQKKKIRTMALSILLAVIVWFMVMSLTNPTITVTLTNLKVRFVGEATLRDRDLTVTGRGNIPPLSVTVRGSRGDLMNYMDDVYIQVDLSNITDAGTYSLTGKPVIPTTRIGVEKENYGNITVNAEKIVSKETEVKVTYTGVPTDKIVRTDIKNPVVEISGAESEINEVDGAQAVINWQDVKEGEAKLEYALINSSGAPITENETIESPRSEIDVVNRIYDAVTLPVEAKLSDGLSGGYELDSPKTEPDRVKVGVEDGAAVPERLTVTIPTIESGEKEFKIDTAEGIYIPADSAAVKVNVSAHEKPVDENNEEQNGD